MARTADANIDPRLLVWGRESMGFSEEEAAKRIRVSPERLAAWERGDERPTVSQLREVAWVYKRPLAVFYLPEPPSDFQPLRDFRRLPETRQERWSPSLHAAVRRGREQQEVALELFDLLDEEPPSLPSVREPLDSPEGLGEEVRQLLGIEPAEQFEWRTQYEALGAWLHAIEQLGVLVLQAGEVALTEMRGFSITEPLPVMVLNGGDAVRGRVFTALHELAHILVNATGVCDLHEAPKVSSEADRIERQCNQVAAAILMPKTEFLDDSIVRRARGEDWTDAEVSSIADRFSVSREAAVRRLVTFGLTTWAFYETKRRKYQLDYERAVEERRRSESRVPHHRLKVRDLGRSYVRLALDAYHQNEITSSELADYLDVNLKHIERMEAEVSSIGTGV